ncbi:glycosyl transferase [Pseudorhodoferax aquiterrae]|uniref:Glycosyl transferase n=1 Tax=Pseudorhodoferax aquiterrae TaxID=747304 RepID=A0ABQ3GBQ1_9BURK|nr:glycosyltransferase [Pseudorhodoferax aquiterrae]GHC99651.1 glycosyl transferase [Pseudorhodoferax aquiterrae]
MAHLVVLHVIAGLGRGGAEAVMARLVAASAAQCRHVVVSLSDDGVHGARLRMQGVSVHTLGWRRGRATAGGLFRLYRVVRDVRPDVVQTWMYHADLVGGLAARLAGVRAVSWGIRNSDLHPQRSSRSARMALRLCALLSAWVPRVIVSCSERAARLHAALGYRADRMQTISNGLDLHTWSVRPQARAEQRARWGIGMAAPLLGMVARWDPQKDHANLFEALSQVARALPELVCVLVGPGMDAENANLIRAIRARGLQGRIVLDGPRDDVVDVVAALDVHVLSSAYGEAFPNVVAEAMACGTPCVVTDVGDSGRIVGACGWVVPPCDAQALGEALQEALTVVCGDGGAALRAACRQHVEEHFGLDRMVQAYLQLWARLRTEGDARCAA